jgi:4-amino-4-deoxy-L-arabinose transferase-like glycosyltransferase
MELFIEKRKNIIVFLVFALALFLIFFHFTDTPRVWVDEGIFTNVAENVALHGQLGLQTDPGSFSRIGTFLSTNYPVIFSVAGSFKLLGVGLWQARLVMVTYMFLLVICFYLFVKKRYGFYSAISSVLLLISFAPFYGNGRPVQGEVPGLFFLVLGALFLVYLESSDFDSKKFAILSGLFLGLAAATKTLYLLLLVVALPLTLLFFIKKIKNKKNVLLLLITFLVPIFFWFIINFPTLDSLTKIIPTIIHQSGNNGGSSLSSTSSSLFSTVFINLLRFVRESTPILFSFLFLSVTFVFVRRYIKKETWDFSIAEYLIFFVIVLNWLGYLLGTGWYRYFFPAHTLLYLLFPGVTWMLVQSIHRSFGKKIYVGILSVLIIFQFSYLIFFSDTSLITISTRNAEVSHLLSVIPSTKKVFFDNSVESVVFLRGGTYSQYVVLPGLFELGTTSSLHDTSNDFILMDSSDQATSTVSSCYAKTTVGTYFLFGKTANCKK